jgi:uncharacterized protein (TIGR03905 family)
MKHIEYQTVGTCSRQINVDVDDNNIIQSVEFIGGCEGNTHGIMKLVKGMDATMVKDKLKGILCGSKGTSCPDQLARALETLEQGK